MPLTPIVGETYSADLQDGTKINLEMVAPNTPYIYVIGPLEGGKPLYTWYGYGKISARSAINSIEVQFVGKKTIKFANGDRIEYTNPSDTFKNTLFGTLTHQLSGSV